MTTMHSTSTPAIVAKTRNRRQRQRHVVLLRLMSFAIGAFCVSSFDYWSQRLLVAAQDEYMTCSRPIKQSRTSKQINLPCEGMEAGKESWCNLPGPAYPWHAVRNFVFENQGLMRRMYGEVRQLSLLRMEFAGESNTLDDHVGSGRDFNDIFQPIAAISPTAFGPTPATTSELVSILSAPAEEKNPGAEYRMVDDEADADADAEFAPSATIAAPTTEAMSASLISIDDEINNVSDGGSNERLTTQTDESGVDITTHDMQHDGLMMDTLPTEEAPTTPILDDDEFGSSEEDGLVIILQTPAPPSNVSVHNASNTSETVLHDEGDRNEEIIEGKNRINHILFQDLEKSSSQPQPQAQPQTTPSIPPPSPQSPPQSQQSPAPSANVEERVRSRVGVNACPVKEEVVAPYWANNTRGEILALLNLYPFEQYIHWEKCTNEHRQMYCRDGCRCEQQYRLHRLLAFDPSNECRGIFSDWFRFPSCCVCKCYFDEMPGTERISFNRSPRIIDPVQESMIQDLDGPDVNGVDDSHFFYKYHHSFRHPRK